MKRETLFLKLAVVLMGIPILAICIFVVPEIGEFAAELYPTMPYLRYLVVIDLYASAIPFYFALYQAFKLLGISIGRSLLGFICESIKEYQILCTYYLWRIRDRHATFLSHGEMDDAPGIILIGLVIIFASFVIAVFAAVLQKLLTDAIEIKSENEFTV
ncbi:DUF2975 domain-containing protein [Sporosarcina thermotolerans]|uniref:DUF2975 domain-containing protein n=1 Tax=Sporosarcina thermotolerans TaxID=633404 RepID=UPI003D2F8622